MKNQLNYVYNERCFLGEVVNLNRLVDVVHIANG